MYFDTVGRSFLTDQSTGIGLTPVPGRLRGTVLELSERITRDGGTISVASVGLATGSKSFESG